MKMKTNYEMEIKQAEARKFQLQKHLQEVAVKTFRNEADNVEDGRINDMYEKTLQIAIKFQQIENQIKECDMEIEVLNRLQQQEEKKEESTTSK